MVVALVGVVVFAVGVATSSTLGALVGLGALSVAVAAVVRLFRCSGTLGRFGVAAYAGFLMLVVGLGLGIQSYDEKYFGDPAERGLWDAVSTIGFFLTVVGFLTTVVALIALPVGAVVRSVRRR